MIIVNLKGGLGNQLFQYAAGRRLSVKHQVPLKFDLGFLENRDPSLNITFREFNLDVFPNLNIEIATEQELNTQKFFLGLDAKNRFLNKLFRKSAYQKEKSFLYNPAFENFGDDIYLDGYWQSEKYFSFIENLLREDLAFPPFSVPQNESLLQQILVGEAVCINVRRGEFLSNKRHGFVGEKFIYDAVNLLQKQIALPTFYIFSDDVEWCQDNLQLPEPFYFVNHSHLGHKYIDYLHLMTSCKHFILSNSTFSWWAAWLNNNPSKTVIAPRKWFGEGPQETQDLFPSSWIQL